MRCILILLLSLTGCASSPEFSRTDYAYPYAGVVCAEIKRNSCGLTLTLCSNELRYECVDNVIIVNIEQIREMQKRSTKHAD